jgi:hypothetical protein
MTCFTHEAERRPGGGLVDPGFGAAVGAIGSDPLEEPAGTRQRQKYRRPGHARTVGGGGRSHTATSSSPAADGPRSSLQALNRRAPGDVYLNKSQRVVLKRRGRGGLELSFTTVRPLSESGGRTRPWPARNAPRRGRPNLRPDDGRRPSPLVESGARRRLYEPFRLVVDLSGLLAQR